MIDVMAYIANTGGTNSVIAFSPLAQGLLAGASKASQVRENINAAKNTLFTQG
ncbi:MAG: hypothetical protein RSB36_02720 [Hydrogenoanaerobacterium sp.]